MRGGRPHGRLRTAQLCGNQRFAHPQCFFGDRFEFLRALYVFEEQQENIRLAFVQHEVDKVENLQACLVAGRHHIAEREFFFPANIKK